MWKQIIVHSFRVVYQHLFTRTEEIYDKIRPEQMTSWPRFAPNTCPIKAGSSKVSDSLLVLCILFSGRKTSSVYGKRYSCTCVLLSTRPQGRMGQRKHITHRDSKDFLSCLQPRIYGKLWAIQSNWRKRSAPCSGPLYILQHILNTQI